MIKYLIVVLAIYTLSACNVRLNVEYINKIYCSSDGVKELYWTDFNVNIVCKNGDKYFIHKDFI